MPLVKTVKLDPSEHHGIALIRKDGTVWVMVCPRRWDLATWLWWWLAPSNGKLWTTITNNEGYSIQTRAIRVATNHVRLG